MMGWLAVTFSLTPLMLGHVIPDKVVYRGIQVVVKPEGIEVRYQLGLNEKTLRRELASRLGTDEGIPADDEEVLAKYRDVILPLLPTKLNVEIDRGALTLTPVRSDLIRQHHAQIECVYWGPFPARTTPSRLTLVDENFAGVPGVHILAVKGRGEIDLLQSDAPALLVRAPVNRMEASDTAIPPASSRRLEAYFCLSGPSPAVSQNTPESAGGRPQPVARQTPGGTTGSTTEDSGIGDRQVRMQDGAAMAQPPRSKGIQDGSRGLSVENSSPSTAFPTTLFLLALLGILICVWLSRRA